MEMTAAAALLRALQEEGVEVIFGYPGGANLPIYDALYDVPIRHVLTRHEQGAIHAAEGYARVTGRAGVVFATSGPGATNLVTGLADAMLDSTPIVAITAQVARSLIGRDAFQEADVTGITMPVAKHNYLITDPNDLLRSVKEAFYVAQSGRPGPVVIDIPKDVLNAKVQWNYPKTVEMPGFSPVLVGNEAQVERAVELIKAAQHPVMICGGGVVISDGAHAEFRQLAEQIGAPVVETLTGLGGFPMDHPQFFGLLGMHGSFAANRAVAHSDVLLAVGMRFGDRVTGMAARFAPKATVIHIDLDPAEMSKNHASHIPIIGDCANVLHQINAEMKGVPAASHGWLDQVQAWHDEHPFWGQRTHEEIPTDADGRPKPQQVIQMIQKQFGTDCIVATDVGQHQMWAAHYCLRSEPRTWLSSCGLGTMGFGLPAALGAKVARPEKEVVLVSGDGSIQMCIQELATIAAEELNVKIFVMNNGYLGMVRQWQEIFFRKRYNAVDLRRGSPDFVKLADAYGIKGIRVTRLGDVEAAVAEAKAHPGPVFVDVHCEEEENVFPLVPPGGVNTEAILKK